MASKTSLAGFAIRKAVLIRSGDKDDVIEYTLLKDKSFDETRATLFLLLFA